MESWSDEGILLQSIPQGERGILATIFTSSQGICRGFLKGGQSPRYGGLLMAGNRLEVHWKARLRTQLGQFRLEMLSPWASSALITGRSSLRRLQVCLDICSQFLPSHVSFTDIYRLLCVLLEEIHLSKEIWIGRYLLWELILLQGLGYGLDLSECALTGTQSNLAYVSPRTGRCVSEEAAGLWKERLFPLPPFFWGQGTFPPSWEDILLGERITGHFLGRFLHENNLGPLSPSRQKLFHPLGA